MIKKFKKTDLIFGFSLLSVLLIHICFVFIIPYIDDESFYVTIPFRLVNGDSLIRHEWHLSQFVALFQYLPVYIWTAIKGSADGIIIFLRCVFLFMHTAMAATIYGFFRKYGVWAVLASMMYYVQVPYRLQALSYQSVFVVFLLLLTLCLLSIYKKDSVHYHIFAGICFGCCCVCNPIFSIAFVLYLIVCALWTKREDFAIRRRISKAKKSGEKITNKQMKQLNEEIRNSKIENYTRFFNKKAILWFLCGILIVAIVAVAFYFLTGGTITSVFKNIGNLLSSSEYDVASSSIFAKLAETLMWFSKANFNIPFILPLIFITLLADKNRMNNKHRFAYLLATLIWSIIFVVRVSMSESFYMGGFSLPFFMISTVCYILTENKNKTLFNCMYMPCLIATVFQYLAANTHLAVIGIVLAVANVAGVFFAKDFWEEAKETLRETDDKKDKKNLEWCRKIIIIGFCLQILFYGIYYQRGQITKLGGEKATTGPYKGLYMSEEEYDDYNSRIKDLEVIKTRTAEDAPILLITYENWMYLHLDRPIATYTTWYRGILYIDQLKTYYQANPKKIPKYIYIDSSGPIDARIKMIGEIFDFSQEELSNGVLLKVERFKR